MIHSTGNVRGTRIVRAALLAFGIAVFANAGCADPTAPVLTQADFVGRYVLVTADGKPMPTRLDSTVLVYYADTLWLAADSTFSEVIVQGRYDQQTRSSGTLTGRWAFRPASTRGRDAVWLAPNYTGTARGLEFPYTIRDRGRQIYSDETLTFAPRPAWVYERR